MVPKTNLLLVHQKLQNRPDTEVIQHHSHLPRMNIYMSMFSSIDPSDACHNGRILYNISRQIPQYPSISLFANETVRLSVLNERRINLE